MSTNQLSAGKSNNPAGSILFLHKLWIPSEIMTKIMAIRNTMYCDSFSEKFEGARGGNQKS